MPSISGAASTHGPEHFPTDRETTSPTESHSSGTSKAQPSVLVRDPARTTIDAGTRDIATAAQQTGAPQAPGPLRRAVPQRTIRPPAAPSPHARPPKLLDRLREALRSRPYSRRTEESYCHWACLLRREPSRLACATRASRGTQTSRFIFLHHVRHPADVAEPEVNAFLSHLATKGKVSASTQNQPLCALFFLVRETILQRAVREATRKAGIVKHVGCHTFRHSGVYPAVCGTTHLLEAGYDNRTIQELLGHSDLNMTMIDTHVLNKGDQGVRSPANDLCPDCTDCINLVARKGSHVRDPSLLRGYGRVPGTRSRFIQTESRLRLLYWTDCLITVRCSDPLLACFNLQEGSDAICHRSI